MTTPITKTKTKIYLLDDDVDVLDLLNDMLEDISLEAECFNQANTFFDEIKQFEDDSLMILDLSMPSMDGIEVMRRLANMPNPPSLILISGHDIGVLHSAEKLGNAHHLEIIASLDKPIKLDQFQCLISQYCDRVGRLKSQHSINIDKKFNDDELLVAIENDQLILFYQPQYNVASQKMVSCEALIRWQHPKNGLIFPDEFIPFVEKNGWMSQMTNWVINAAVKQQQQWKNLGYSTPISINISAEDITSLSLPEQITELLESKQLEPNLLQLEITESALIGELVTCLDILTRLRLKGIALSIDDFGTGYSSLSHLHKIPFTELKIDRSFVMSMLEDNEAEAIVKTCIMLGHELNMKIVAEGVETQQHLIKLDQLGCDIAQGYYFSKPISAKHLTQLLQDDVPQDILIQGNKI